MRVQKIHKQKGSTKPFGKKPMEGHCPTIVSRMLDPFGNLAFGCMLSGD